MGFGSTDYPCHHLYRFHRKGTNRTFGRQHHRVRTIKNSPGHIRRLGTCWCGAVDHGFQHLRCHHHRLADQPAFSNDFLLPAGHIFGRQLHAQITTRHHDTVSGRYDIRKLGKRGRFFDFRHQRGPAINKRLGLNDVAGTLYE